LRESLLFPSLNHVSTSLLGDPQQLEQPQLGTHPEGSDISALAHLLGGRRTIDEEQGILLAETLGACSRG
jgi:uncharacterized protein